MSSRSGRNYWQCHAVALGASVLWLLLAFTLRTPSGLTRTVYREHGFGGGAAHVDVVPDVDLRFTDRPHGPRRFFSARWAGVWHVDRAGAHDLFSRRGRCGSAADRWARSCWSAAPRVGFPTTSVSRELTAGPHRIEIDYEQRAGGMFLNVGWARRGEAQKRFDQAQLFPAAPTPRQIRINAMIDGAAYVVAVAWLLTIVVAVRFAWRRSRSANGGLVGQPERWSAWLDGRSGPVGKVARARGGGASS